MATTVPEIRIAVFGMSGSGKTVLLSSYFGNQQRNAFEERHGYRLEAEDATQGNDLLAHYYRMERGSFPNSTDRFDEYRFAFKVGELNQTGLRVVWYDYPGEWWQRTPSDSDERVARAEAIQNLVKSHVGMLLIDGAHYRAEGVSYVQHVLDQFKNEARKIIKDSADQGSPVSAMPDQWIIAVTKADLLDDGLTAEQVCTDIIAGCQDQLKGIAKVFHAPNFGTRFLLLSAVRGDGNTVVDAHSYVGLQLIAPAALLAVLDKLAGEAGKGRLFGALKFLVERLSALVDIVDKLDDFLPEKYQILTALLKVLATKEVLNKGSEYFRDKQKAAAARGQALEATAAAMRAEMLSAEAQTAFFANQP